LQCPAHSIVLCYHYCTYLACSGCHYACSVIYSYCPFGSITPTITHTVTGCGGSWTDPINPAGGVANLKEQLKLALEQAERQEAAEGEALKVQTVADAEMLEKKLAEAIEDVRARKAELQKKK